MIPNATEVPKWLRPGYEHRVKKTLHAYHAALATARNEEACQRIPGLRWLRIALEEHLSRVPEHVIACTAIDIGTQTCRAGEQTRWVVNATDNIAWLYNDQQYADQTNPRWVMEFTEDEDYANHRPEFAIMGFELQEFFLRWRINDERWLGLPAQIYAMAVKAGFAHESIETEFGIRSLHLRNGRVRLTIRVYPQVVLRSQERMFYLFREWERDHESP